jgi:hypothetical protein
MKNICYTAIKTTTHASVRVLSSLLGVILFSNKQ